MGEGNGMGGIIGLMREQEVRAELSIEDVQGEQVEKKEKREKLRLSAWCFDLGRAVKAKEWVRRGPEISFAIPCSVFGDDASEHKSDTDVSDSLSR